MIQKILFAGLNKTIQKLLENCFPFRSDLKIDVDIEKIRKKGKAEEI